MERKSDGEPTEPHNDAVAAHPSEEPAVAEPSAIDPLVEAAEANRRSKEISDTATKQWLSGEISYDEFCLVQDAVTTSMNVRRNAETKRVLAIHKQNGVGLLGRLAVRMRRFWRP